MLLAGGGWAPGWALDGLWMGYRMSSHLTDTPLALLYTTLCDIVTKHKEQT
jgi:hypothetical protein